MQTLSLEPKTLERKVEPFSILFLRDRLKKAFSRELSYSDSVFVSIHPLLIEKMIHFIATKSLDSASVGIAGVTASGKSTIAIDIIDTLENFACQNEIKDIITRVNTDDYYYDRSAEVKKAGSFENFAKNYNFDTPKALELDLMVKNIRALRQKEEVYLPKYDMSGTAKRVDNNTLAKPAKIIIAEGLYTLSCEVKTAFDFKIYVHIDEKVQRERFFRRAAERDLGSSAQIMYNTARKNAKIFVEPTVKYADLVLSGEAQRYRYKLFLDEILNIIKEFYASYG